MKKVVIYSSDRCPYCDMAKSLLTREKIPFNEINVSYNDTLKEEMIQKSNGMRTVPQIFIGEHHIGGYDDLHKIYANKDLQKYL
jgi:glutaredoxin 3